MTPDKPIVSDTVELSWPEKLTLRDTKVFADEGQRIFTTATGYGYEKCEYVRADLAAPVKQPVGEVTDNSLRDEILSIVFKNGANFSVAYPASETIREMQKLGWVKSYDSCFGRLYFDVTDAGKAALASNPPEAPTVEADKQKVRVKPLEWIEYPNTYSPDVFGHFWDAETPFIRYTIEEVSGPDFDSETPRYEVNRGRDCLICTKSVLLEAKAAAQADYETRILSALQTNGGTKP